MTDGQSEALENAFPDFPPEPQMECSDCEARFAELAVELAEAEKRVEDLKKEKAYLEQVILPQWLDKGQQNARIKGMTIYVANEFFCTKKGGIDTRVVCDTLANFGLHGFVAPSYNAQSLKAWVKEQREAGATIPQELESMLNIQEVQKLRVRKA